MAHSQFENLLDLEVELNEIRKLLGIREKSPGIFYYKSISFLHFHDANGDRWADVKTDGVWLRIALPFDAKKSQRKAFLKAVTEAHGKMSSQGRKREV